MLNVSFPNIDWVQVKFIAFDIDGTLYDEFDTIKQVYKKILELYSDDRDEDPYQYMTSRWLDKGSSYPHIFSETYDLYFDNDLNKDDFIKDCLNIYRNFYPNINLSSRANYLLKELPEKFKQDLYIISDGPEALQQNKVLSLGLEKYFNSQNIFLTGSYGPDHYKPNTKINEIMRLPLGQEVLYFGDREIDKEFAEKLGWQFQQVFCMKGLS